MSITSISVKHNNHRIHPCKTDKKLELLNLLITQNSGLNIVVVSSNNLDIIKDGVENKTILVKNDEDIMNTPEVQYQVLISYDLPLTGIEYLARVAHASEKAIILLDLHEQKNLYPIETLLGRTLKQEIIIGFEPEEIELKRTAFTKPTKSQERDKEVTKKEFKPRDDKREFKPRNDKKEFKPRDDKREFKPRDDKKEFKPRDDKREFKPRDDKKEFKPRDDKREFKPRDDKKEFKPRDDKREFKPRDDKKEFKPKYEKSDEKPYDKNKQANKKNKFLGKDENGKGLFSGKSGDRNHRYDGSAREQYDAPKKVGKAINIKSLKDKKETK